jgi:hypothetical protein
MKRLLNVDFRCIHCKAYVVANAVFAGVKHRNHCPYCLWSRHMDLKVPGDRLSACKAKMRPLGLTLKLSPRRYNQRAGELMLCHQCTDCGKISINRIAADDDSERLYALLLVGDRLMPDSPPDQVYPASSMDFIRFLGIGDRSLVYARLFGVAG